MCVLCVGDGYVAVMTTRTQDKDPVNAGDRFDPMKGPASAIPSGSILARLQKGPLQKGLFSSNDSGHGSLAQVLQHTSTISYVGRVTS